MRTTCVIGLVLATAAAAQSWTELGPIPILAGPYTGRVAAIACDPLEPDVYWVGGADGGVWRTRNGGSDWKFVTAELATTAIGALAIDPTDPDTVWAGTGEANFANHSRYGLGIAKTTDGGSTWTLFGAAEFAGRSIARIRVDPADPRRLFAATTHAGGFPARSAARNHPFANGPVGVFRSLDGGITWTQLQNGLPTTRSATDVALDPQDPNRVLVAIGDPFGSPDNGLYRSTDGGQSFQRLTLPSTNVGRLTIAIAPSRAQRIYVQAALPATPTGGGASTLDVWRSDDAGQTWTGTSPGSHQSTFGWYASTATVRPTDPNVILVGGLSLRRSTQGGGGWQTVTPPHVDIHALEWDAAGRLLSGNDGGIHRSSDLGSSWNSVNGNLGLVQLYAGISLDPSSTEIVHCGTQDNGSMTRVSGSTAWTQRLGGDGGYTGIDSTGTRLFMENQGTGNLYRSLNGGSLQRQSSGITGRNCFLPPYEIHPQNPLDMIYGTERVFRSTDGASSWSPISPDLTAGGAAAIQGLAWSTSDPRVIWASTNDGRVQVTTDLGQSWRLVRQGLVTWARTTRPFALHPTDPRRAWLAVGGFAVDQVLETRDSGATWRAIDGDLPDLPAHAVAIDVRAEPVLVYVGTDQGVYCTVDGGRRWRRYGPGLPNAPVTDLRADVRNLRLVAGTQGRGVWQIAMKEPETLPFVTPR